MNNDELDYLLDGDEDDEASRLLPSCLRVSDAASLLRVHPDTVRGWIRDGKLKAIRVGHTIRLTQSEVRRFLLAHQALVGSDAEEQTDGAPVKPTSEPQKGHPVDALVTRMRGVELALLEGRNGLRSLLDDWDAASGLSADTKLEMERFVALLDEGLYGVNGAPSSGSRSEARKAAANARGSCAQTDMLSANTVEESTAV